MPQKWKTNGEVISAWWELFEDPQLTALIEESLSCSYETQVALLRLGRARLERKKALSYAWPRLGLNFDTARFDQSADFPIVTTKNGFEIYEAGFDAFWEIDLFGKMRRGQELADAALASSEERLHLIRLSLAAEIARHYFDLRHLQAQQLIVKQTLLLQKELLQNAQMKSEQQLGSTQSALVLMQQIDQTDKQLIAFDAQIQMTMNRLAFIVNGMPGSLNERLSCFEGLPHQPEKPAIGLPSELLCRRPDIRLAEALLAYKTASIGIAISDFLPKFDLFANLGLLSTLFPQLFRADSYLGIYNLLAQMPLFQGGKLIAQLQIAKTEEKEALIEYTKAVLGAFHEVDAALVRFEEKCAAYEKLEAIFCASQEFTYNLESIEQEELISKEEIKKQELQLLETQSGLLKGQIELLEETLALFKALGGGWDCF